jgi:hypothetical protein
MLASQEKPPPPFIMLSLEKNMLNDLDCRILIYEWTLSKD